MKKFFRDNSLSFVLVSLFLVFWVGQGVTGFYQHNHEEQSHDRPRISPGEYMASDHFWEATFENWESEFFQMAAYVVLTVFLYQRGSAESRDPDKARRLHRLEKKARRRMSWRTRLYAHSLSLTLVGLFVLSWSGHAVTGWKHYNGEQAEHGEATVTLGQFLGSAQFWFESFQNWQSEFLAVGSIVILSIWLREKNSPESKKLTSTTKETGK